MVIYNGREYGLNGLGELPERRYRIIKEKTKHYDESFIPSGPAIPRDKLKEVIEENGWDADKVVIFDDFVTHSRYRHLSGEVKG